VVLSSGYYLRPSKAYLFEGYLQQVRRSGNVNGKTWVVPDILTQRLPSPENHSMGLSILRATLDRPSIFTALPGVACQAGAFVRSGFVKEASAIMETGRRGTCCDLLKDGMEAIEILGAI